jgi:uncharacterized protein YgiM (DUF1202 family)
MRVRVLVLCLLTLAMFGCSGAENVEETETPAAIATEEPATATRISPSPTLRPSATATTPAPTPTTRATATIMITSTPENVTKVEVTVGAANLRLGAGTEFAVVGVIVAGEEPTLLETNPDETWYKVRTAEGVEGWVGSSVARMVEGED